MCGSVLWDVDRLQPELHLVLGQTPFPPHLGQRQVSKGWSKPEGQRGLPCGTEKARPDGPMTSALVTTHQRKRRDNAFKIYRREE